MNKKFRVALVGCGNISDNHIDALINNPDVDLVALCDDDVEHAVAKREKFDLHCPIFGEYRVLLETLELDAVHIATPHYLHCEMACRALERNINVFLEKPMCIKKEEIDKLIQAEKNSKARVCVCFQNRFNPATVYAKEIADADGGVVSAYASLFWHRDEQYYNSAGWRGKKATEGGGVMINQAIHTLDLLCFFLGIPEKVCATTANHTLKGVIDVEDSCEGTVEFANGRRACFYATNAYVGDDTTTICLTTANHKIEIRTSHLYVDGERITDADNVIPAYGKACYGSGHTELIARFYESLKLGTPMPVTLESAQYAVRLLLAAYESKDTDIQI